MHDNALYVVIDISISSGKVDSVFKKFFDYRWIEATISNFKNLQLAFSGKFLNHDMTMFVDLHCLSLDLRLML